MNGRGQLLRLWCLTGSGLSKGTVIKTDASIRGFTFKKKGEAVKKLIVFVIAVAFTNQLLLSLYINHN